MVPPWSYQVLRPHERRLRVLEARLSTHLSSRPLRVPVASLDCVRNSFTEAFFPRFMVSLALACKTADQLVLSRG